MFKVTVTDKNVKSFVKKSPARARWALREALAALGGSLRKKIMVQIHRHPGWPPLHPETLKRKRKDRYQRHLLQPLQVFSRLVSFRVRTVKGVVRMRVGLLGGWGSAWFKNWSRYSLPVIARLHEHGGTHPVLGRRPRRPMIGPVFRKETSRMGGYVEKKFFENFFSEKRKILKY